MDFCRWFGRFDFLRLCKTHNFGEKGSGKEKKTRNFGWSGGGGVQGRVSRAGCPGQGVRRTGVRGRGSGGGRFGGGGSGGGVSGAECRWQGCPGQGGPGHVLPVSKTWPQEQNWPKQHLVSPQKKHMARGSKT